MSSIAVQIIKVIITAFLVVAISEAGKRFSALGAVLASLPLTSLLAFIWLHVDTGDKTKISELSLSIFWMVIPSLAFFIALPLLLKKFSFWPSMGFSAIITFGCYSLFMLFLDKIGIKL